MSIFSLSFLFQSFIFIEMMDTFECQLKCNSRSEVKQGDAKRKRRAKRAKKINIYYT